MTTDKDHRRMLGGSGIAVSPIAFGLWRFVGSDVAAALSRVYAALDHGIDFFDVAAVYGLDWGGSAFGESEALLGQALAREPALRKRIVLATKFGIVPGIPYDSGPDAVVASCEASLKRLNTDVIDLFQVHRPDVLTHPTDLADALSSLKRQGKIRAAGVSNYSAPQTLVLQQFLDFELASHQPEFSALHLDPVHDGVFDQCLSRHMTPMAWSPLGGGKLALSHHEAHQADPSGRLAKTIAALDRVAQQHGVSRTVLALAFVMRHPARPIPVIGTQTPARMAEAMRATDVVLSRAEWYAIASAAGMPLP
jgi:aryl-alcohol dehydrogenase-like predicted oxidoreductase